MMHAAARTIAVMAALGAITSCKPAADTQPEIVIGVSPFQDTIMPMVAQEKGWYREAGLKVRFVVLGWTEVNEALSAPASSGVQVAINNECGVISAHIRNPKIVYYYGINPFDNGFALMVRPTGPLRSVTALAASGLDRAGAIAAAAAQLKGRTVITTSNTDMEQGVAAAARRAGLNFRTDLKIINLPPEEGLAAFLSGQGDAYIGGIPQRLAAKKAGMVEMLTGNDLGPAPVNGFVTTTAFLQAHPEAMPKLLAVWFRTVQYTNGHKDEVAGIVSRLLKARGVNLSSSDFLSNWNKVESFPATPAAAASEMLQPTGRNYWKRRWDDCNEYYVNVVKTNPRSVSPSDAFFMGRAQGAVQKASAALSGSVEK